jgi:hypothetical protein
MKLRIGLLTIALTVFALNATAQNNQDRWAFELSTGASYATTEIGDANLKAGPAIEGTFYYRFLEHTSIYLGWGWKKFGSNHSFAGNNMDFEETGYTYGVQFKHPLANTRLNYVVRAGGIYNHVEIENTDGDIISDTGHGLGWQAVGGIELSLGRSWTLIPMVKYSSLSRDFESGTDEFNSNLNTLSTQIGFAKNF